MVITGNHVNKIPSVSTVTVRVVCVEATGTTGLRVATIPSLANWAGSDHYILNF